MPIRVVLPAHLRKLSGTDAEVELVIEDDGGLTIPKVLDALEQAYPTLRGTVREYGTGRRRPFVRFFVCGEDWSHHAPDVLLPAAITRGEDALLIVGAIAGG